MSPEVENAMRVAVVAHEQQRRKEANIPYISHPCMVALMLRGYGFSDTVVAAALTHDVLEDSDITADELRAAIGDEACDIVQAVTYDDGLSWEEKRTAYIERIRNGSEGVKAVAVADKIHNLQCLLRAYEEQGGAVWSNFNASMERKMAFEDGVLAALRETWDHPLVAEYETLVGQLRAALESV